MDGNPTVDPEAALLGAVLPMAGYKGAGLALMIDALCGVLTGAAFGRHIVDLYDERDEHQNVGHFFIAIGVEDHLIGFYGSMGFTRFKADAISPAGGRRMVLLFDVQDPRHAQKATLAGWLYPSLFKPQP